MCRRCSFAEAKQFMAMGFRHIRLQYNGYGATIPTDAKVDRSPGASDGPTDQDSTYDRESTSNPSVACEL